jgi:HTH-type transcriptional repressor of NAD biosynthesis genes
LITGLTLGKYSPLHSGHESLFKHALSEAGHLIAVIYNSPETTNIPLQVRAGWIRKLYPMIEVIEAWDGPAETGNTPEIKKLHEDYLLKLLQGRDISYFYTAEFYGEHVSQALNSKWRKLYRKENGISGTLVRQSPYKQRMNLHPVVYKDFVVNIAFLGAPGTGKTTLCEALAHKFKTKWMPEYGREFWEKHQVQRRLSEGQLIEIAQGHIERENELIYESDRFLFTDTNALTTRLFSIYYHNSCANELEQLADDAEKRYDLYFLCDTDFPCPDTWDRSGEGNRQWFQQQILSDLRARKIPFFTLSGDLKSRVESVSRMISNLTKFDNYFDKINQAIA